MLKNLSNYVVICYNCRKSEKTKGKFRMVFSSLEFIFIFLPIFLCIYYLVPNAFKNFVLLLGSFAFYTYGAVNYPVHIALLLASIAVNYFAARLCAPGRRFRKAVFILCLLYNFLWLGLFKYSGFICDNISSILSFFGTSPINAPSLVLPLGISFYTFQIVSYVIDVYKGAVPKEDSIVSLGAYLCMFPQLIAGPIVTYGEIRAQMHSRTLTFADFNEGLKDFTVGLGLKVLLANRIGNLWNDVNIIGFQSISSPLAWMGIIAYSLQIYFDFYGYSLMAIGLGRMLGFSMPENFDHPYVSLSMTEFWRRWHITLGSWFREYVYIPLGGNRKGKARTYFNLFVTWLLTGIWHGAAWNFLLWGLFLFIIIAAEKAGLKKILDKSRILGRLYMTLLIPLSWMIFAITDLKQIAMYFTRLFPFFNTGIYIYEYDYIKHAKLYGVYLLIGLLFCTGLPKKIYLKIKDNAFGSLVLAAVFWASVYCIYRGMNDPFLYFRF